MIASYFRKKPYSEKKNKKHSSSQPPFNAKRHINDYLQTKNEENPSFMAFSRERDHIGRILSVIFLLKPLLFSYYKPKEPMIDKIPAKSQKLLFKVAKNEYSDNLVLVRKNNFLFFEKGTGMKSKLNSKALLGNDLRLDVFENDKTINSFENSKNHSGMLNILDYSNVQSAKERKNIQNSLPKLKFIPTAKDSNHDLDNKKRNLMKIGKIVDPCRQEKAMSLISHLGLYDPNYSLILPKESSFFFSKSEKYKKIMLPPIKPKSLYRLKHKKLYEKGEFEDERLLFAKVMKDISNEVNDSLGGNEENLGIEKTLDYRYSHTKDFVKGFHDVMKTGFDFVKKRFMNIKAINEKWEKEMYMN